MDIHKKESKRGRRKVHTLYILPLSLQFETVFCSTSNFRKFSMTCKLLTEICYDKTANVSNFNNT